jgi:hypothetical protein
MHAMDLAAEFRAMSQRLQLWIETVSPPSANGPSISPEQISAVLSELMQAGTLIQRCRAIQDPAIQDELRIYREHVQRLKTLLPSLHESLVRERDRLSRRLSGVQAASEWVLASRQTL